jgi:hypothetical protein
VLQQLVAFSLQSQSLRSVSGHELCSEHVAGKSVLGMSSKSGP